MNANNECRHCHTPANTLSAIQAVVFAETGACFDCYKQHMTGCVLCGNDAGENVLCDECGPKVTLAEMIRYTTGERLMVQVAGKLLSILELAVSYYADGWQTNSALRNEAAEMLPAEMIQAMPYLIHAVSRWVTFQRGRCTIEMALSGHGQEEEGDDE